MKFDIQVHELIVNCLLGRSSWHWHGQYLAMCMVWIFASRRKIDGSTTEIRRLSENLNCGWLRISPSSALPPVPGGQLHLLGIGIQTVAVQL